MKWYSFCQNERNEIVDVQMIHNMSFLALWDWRWASIRLDKVNKNCVETHLHWIFVCFVVTFRLELRKLGTQNGLSWGTLCLDCQMSLNLMVSGCLGYLCQTLHYMIKMEHKEGFIGFAGTPLKLGPDRCNSQYIKSSPHSRYKDHNH